MTGDATLTPPLTVQLRAPLNVVAAWYVGAAPLYSPRQAVALVAVLVLSRNPGHRSPLQRRRCIGLVNYQCISAVPHWRPERERPPPASHRRRRHCLHCHQRRRRTGSDSTPRPVRRLPWMGCNAEQSATACAAVWRPGNRLAQPLQGPLVRSGRGEGGGYWSSSMQCWTIQRRVHACYSLCRMVTFCKGPTSALCCS